jgi:recombinational DNA repair ATPase RecF
MIKIETIRLEEFRGVRDLTLSLRGKNFAICGPNGTGKSGVVDALEFGLTGNISRLSGEGSDNLSVKEHAPHVDSRNAPEKARVTITATIPALGKTVSITRTVKTPSASVISPADPDVVAVFRQLEQHPEFVLTRRELIRYVLSPPGKRAKEVQALLRLDRVDDARGAFQKISNRCKRMVAGAVDTRSRAKEQLERGLGIPNLTPQDVLLAANLQRGVLGLPPLAELTAVTSLKEGILTTPGAKVSPRIVKSVATAELLQLRTDLGISSNADTAAEVTKALTFLKAMIASEPLLKKLTQEGFLRTGVSFIDANACPLCDTEWDPVGLRAHIQSKLTRLADISRQRADAERKLKPLTAGLVKVRDGVDAALKIGALASPPFDVEPLRDFRKGVEAAIKSLEALLPLTESIATLQSFPTASARAQESLANVERFVASIPEPNKQDAARDVLSVAQDRLEGYREASRTLAKAQAEEKLSRSIFDTYTKTSNGVLEGLYRKVEEEFAALYREINRDDEGGFTARLKPSLGKLGFDVEFYGRGHFPPGAYHSEGHQDGMGLCLYLALMRHLLGTGFTFAVLDDVLMSVDAGHRREVCSLLKREFPDTQFILTTHDPIWLRHMKTEGLLAAKSSVQFRGWNVDHGPTEWDDRDVWEEIEDYLKKNDVRGAASLLRYYLEYIAGDICHRLRASVEYRGDAQYQLGDILPQATARLGDLYAKGNKAANSWGKADVIKVISASSEAFGKIVSASQVERWQINPAVHYNKWASFDKADFIPVVKACKELIGAFQCPSPQCQAYLHVTPDRERAETLRCDCGGISINLLEKT